MNILITGGAGFVGSNLAINFKGENSVAKVVCLDNLKRRGSELNLARLEANGIQFIHGDVRCKEDLEAIRDIDVVIDASAEPSVLAGVSGSIHEVFNNNLVGTINCLELARKLGSIFVFLSTSRVYPIVALESLPIVESETRYKLTEVMSNNGFSERGISEQFSLEGARSYYGATKLASELMINEYNFLSGVKSVINRCGVISGPWQMGKVDQGVVVLWMARHYWKQKLAYIGYGGSGKQTRDILNVKDLYRLVKWQIENIEKVNGQTFNVGGGLRNSASLLELTTICSEITGNTILIDRIMENRTADIKLYLTDNSKVTAATGWAPQIGIHETLLEIHEWISKNESILTKILS